VRERRELVQGRKPRADHSQRVQVRVCQEECQIWAEHHSISIACFLVFWDHRVLEEPQMPILVSKLVEMEEQCQISHNCLGSWEDLVEQEGLGTACHQCCKTCLDHLKQPKHDQLRPLVVLHRHLLNLQELKVEQIQQSNFLIKFSSESGNKSTTCMAARYSQDHQCLKARSRETLWFFWDHIFQI
jgi:hypothetical protein